MRLVARADIRCTVVPRCMLTEAIVLVSIERDHPASSLTNAEAPTLFEVVVGAMSAS